MKLCLVIESGTDVRLVEGLASRCALTVLARPIPSGATISRPTDAAALRLGPGGRAAFAAFATRALVAAGARFDRVLVQGYGLAALAAAAARAITRVPHVMLVCSPAEHYYQCRRVNGDDAQPYSAAAHAGIVAAAGLNAQVGAPYVVLSRYLASVVREHGARGRVAVVPVYGVDTDRFAPPTESRAALRERLGLPAGGHLVFHSSRVAPEKDTPTVLAALARLLAEGRDVRLLHRSGGWRDVAALAQRAGVADRVIATDAAHPQKDLAWSYQASDLVVQASLDEGLGFSVLEALACHTPVVATAVGGLRETIVAGRTGWTVPPRDADALARAMADALDHPAEARARAEAGRALVLSGYRETDVFDRLLAELDAAA